MTKPKDPKDYKKIGAPCFPYDEYLALEICEAISSSHEGLQHLCNANNHWPHSKTIYKWVLQIPAFGVMYAHAREIQQEARVNHAYDVVNNRESDMYEGKEGIKPNMAAVARDKLITDTIKWEAARLSRRYREKQQIESTIVPHETSLKDLDK